MKNKKEAIELINNLIDEVRFARDNCAQEWNFMKNHKFEFEAAALMKQKEAYDKVLSMLYDAKTDLS